MRPSRLLRLPEVIERVGLSKTTLWRLRQAGEFPEPVALSLGRNGWYEADIDRWIAGRRPTRAEDALGHDADAD